MTYYMTYSILCFQQIYTQEMSGLSENAKSRLAFTSARRSMIAEREEAIPSSPETFEEAILGFEGQTTQRSTKISTWAMRNTTSKVNKSYY